MYSLTLRFYSFTPSVPQPKRSNILTKSRYIPSEGKFGPCSRGREGTIDNFALQTFELPFQVFIAPAIQPCTPCHSRGLWAFAFRFLISHLPYFSIKYLSVKSSCFLIFLSLSHRPSTTSRYEYNMKHHKKSIIYTSYVERKENLHCHILGIYFWQQISVFLQFDEVIQFIKLRELFSQ